MKQIPGKEAIMKIVTTDGDLKEIREYIKNEMGGN